MTANGAIPTKTTNGLAEVKNGRISVYGPREGGTPATVVPPPGLKLLLNGLEVAGPVQVKESDSLEVRPLPQVREGKAEIQVSPDKMTATLRLTPHEIITPELVDTPPANSLRLQVRERRTLEPPVNLPGLLRLAAERKITYGLDREALQKALESISTGDFPAEGMVVARGKPPVKGEDARVELLIQLEEETISPRERENGRIDYRELRRWPSVEAGTLIAVKHPPGEGEPGLTITGEPVSPPPPLDLELVARQGVVVTGEGRAVMATAPGRPVMEQRGRGKVQFQVLQVLTLDTVDLSTGNVAFKGDVVIRGSVADGMTVKADGAIRVQGNVGQARLEAGGDIEVAGSAVNSHLRAGGPEAFYLGLAPLLHDLEEEMGGVIVSIAQLEKHPSFQTGDLAERGLGHLLLVLIENKFKRLPSLAQEMAQLVSKASLPLNPEVEKLAGLLPARLIGRGVLENRTREDVALLYRSIQQVRQMVDSLGGRRARISVGYAQNARLEASGDVAVTRRGCYFCQITAQGVVQAQGVVRGGEIYAGEGASLEEAGSTTGAPCLVRVPAGKIIRIKTARENVMIRVGKLVHKFETEDHMVAARIGPEGDLLLH